MILKLNLIGYWQEEGEDFFELNPKVIQNQNNWDLNEKDGIINYLNNSYIFADYMGYSYDRINPNTPCNVMGLSLIHI